MRKNIRVKTLCEAMLEQAKKVNGRLCVVDGEHAFFHRWVQEDRLVVQFNCLIREAEAEAKAKKSQETGLYGPGQETRIVTQTFALVEMLDGYVKKVAPEKVRFCDIEEAEESEEVKCKDCEFLMFSDCYAECSKAFKGILNTLDDSCGKGKRREKKR